MKKKYESPRTSAVRMDSMPLLIGESIKVDDEKIGNVYPSDPPSNSEPAQDDGWDEDDWGNNW